MSDDWNPSARPVAGKCWDEADSERLFGRERPVSTGILNEATEATPGGYTRSGFTREAGRSVSMSATDDGMVRFTADRFAIEPGAAPAGYEPLARILADALAQAAHGKGRERHGNGLPFAEQPMLEITRMVGLGFTTGQAIKKAQEAAGMAARGETDAAKRELLGVIVYAAGAVLALEGRSATEKPEADRDAVLDDDSLARQIGEIGNQLHNLGCEHQNDEALSERLQELRSMAWKLARTAAEGKA